MGNTAFSTKGCVDNFKEDYFEKLLDGLRHEDFKQELRNRIESGKESSSKWLDNEVAKLNTIRDKLPVILRGKYSNMVKNVTDKQNDQNNKMFEEVLNEINFEDITRGDIDKLKRRFNDFINHIVLGHSDPEFPKQLATLIYVYSLQRNIDLLQNIQRSNFEKKILQGLKRVGFTKSEGFQNNDEGFQNNDEDIDFYKILLILVLIILILHICGDLKF
jgi:hypothetical protein